ncbi:MAG: hypothetical protein A3G59_03400 [Candidatus Taylorbacteria bacterium RIFCSPLOWO2_12_FULL_47_20]|uniref:Phosphatidic acid phosphatase type 2/haloperoxidase domain-containing protein n=2 Tax=Candidatus Tayloriibacteriota TaxID=1817919 RepID=A0A1G2PBB7_9BACT|nr:MAG: hypothetical protein A3H68_02255 [Candidatus Taylorbacteria bacterium RIFCSPLOWO2_02_FULL_46_40]OHA45637.1 MAG: hypothetical protein A3G59_03400 [Candidatus Taylorbacteria bacterium RIFCSPLOWO2_12_FULL_47_20]
MSSKSKSFFWMGVAGAAMLALIVFLRLKGFLEAGDELIIKSMEGVPGWLSNLFAAVTYLGATETAVVLTLIGAVLFWKYRGAKQAFFFAAAVAFTRVVTFILKETLGLPRPVLGLEEEGFGFPSGHASFIVSFFAGLYFLGGFTKSRLYAIVFIVIGSLVCVSRVVLNVHFASDVVGGIFVGLTIPLFLLAWYESGGVADVKS